MDFIFRQKWILFFAAAGALSYFPSNAAFYQQPMAIFFPAKNTAAPTTQLEIFERLEKKPLKIAARIQRKDEVFFIVLSLQFIAQTQSVDAVGVLIPENQPHLFNLLRVDPSMQNGELSLQLVPQSASGLMRSADFSKVLTENIRLRIFIDQQGQMQLGLWNSLNSPYLMKPHFISADGIKPFLGKWQGEDLQKEGAWNLNSAGFEITGNLVHNDSQEKCSASLYGFNVDDNLSFVFSAGGNSVMCLAGVYKLARSGETLNGVFYNSTGQRIYVELRPLR